MSGSMGTPGVSNRWSCSTLNDGLNHVEKDFQGHVDMDDDALEAELLAELEER